MESDRQFRIQERKFENLRSSKSFKYEDNITKALTTSYQKISFGFTSRQILIFNDATTDIHFNFDGQINSVLKSGENITLPLVKDFIFLKGASGSEAYRLFII